MTFAPYSMIVRSLALAGLALFLSASPGGSGGGGTTPLPTPATGSVTIAGTVSGTIIKAVRADTNAVISQADTALLPGPPPFTFTLSDIPVGVPVKVFFFSAGQTFPFYGGSPLTNVFTVQTAVPIDLGFVTMSGVRATSPNQLTNVTLGAEDPIVPQGIVPPPATLMVTTHAPTTGSAIVDFAVQNFTIGGQGQQHLHISVDGGATHHFFNGSTNNVLDDNGQPTSNVQRQSIGSFRLNNLPVGQHLVTARLATASNIEFTNTEAKPPVTINSLPAPPATLTITSPSPGASSPSGSVLVSFTVQNFTIGGQGTPHFHIYLDGGTANHFFNGTTNNVLDGNGQPVANITRLSTTSFQITGLSGPHTIHLRLADGVEQELQNTEAKPPDLNFSVQSPPGSPTLTINSPAPGASLPVGPVLVTFTIQNSPIGPSTTRSRMHFYIDNDPIVYKFYDGQGSTEEGNSSGVRYQGFHTHFVHWKSASSFAINGLASGTHQVKFVLTDANDNELSNPEATKSLIFSVSTPPTKDLVLEPVLTGLNFPVGMSLAPDKRIFYNERLTGAIRIIKPGWLLDPTSCANIRVATDTEQGLLGLTLHPNFAQNHWVYVYYTEIGGTRNRVVRYTESSGICTLDKVILDDLPVNTFHIGGIIQFGPDGMLYVVIGETGNPPLSQDLTSLAGKILRVNPTDGSAPADNPFISNANANAKKVYSLGHRNSFGFTFHGHTGHLWETENGENDNDEINRIVSGGNYGWPTVAGIAGNANFRNPILTYTHTIAPTGIISIPENSAVYPAAYQNNLLFVDYKEGRIRRVVLSGADLTQLGSSSIAYNGGNGQLISLMLGEDGFVYVSNTLGGIFKVVSK